MPTNFLWYAGSSGNTGLLTTLTLLTTEMNGLSGSGALGSGVISSVAGASGLISSTSTAQGMQGDVWFQCGGTFGTAVSTGGVLSGWFLHQAPNAPQYETPTSGTPPPRVPDFTIPLVGTPGALTWWKSQGVHAVLFPAVEFKIYLQDNLGAGLPLASNLLIAQLVAPQY